jgi:signal peptidase I
MNRYSQYSYPADDDDAWEQPASGYKQRGYGGSGRGPLPPPLPPEDPPPPRRRRRPAAEPRRAHLAREIIETLVLTALIFVAIRFSVQTFRVEGPSMQPGLHDNEYVLVNKLAYLFHGPSRGDVIVFHWPKNPSQDFIKRVIGLPGDKITWTNDSILVNGVKLTNEPYISAPVNPNIPPVPIVLASDQYFVMGDNRPFSSDSRSWGPVPKSYIIGKATVIFWPLSNWEVIPTYSNIYAGVPAP